MEEFDKHKAQDRWRSTHHRDGGGLIEMSSHSTFKLRVKMSRLSNPQVIY
ncbi:hypothetical protein O9929_14400 [Vibrio lentus]|nr:hypothetical protein [Vibrio lentus]